MSKDNNRNRECKAFDIPEETGEVGSALDAFMQAFEQFKEANDARLNEIDRKLSADVVTEEKVSRLNSALDKQEKALNHLLIGMNRPELETTAFKAAHHGEHREGFERYVRKGDLTHLSSHEEKALSASSDNAGGYIVPEEIDSRIHSLLRAVSPIRGIATVRRSSAGTYKSTLARTDIEASWQSETAARAETDTPTIEEIDIPSGELYALPAATQTILDDAEIDIGEWLAQELQTVFGIKESTAFVSGDGTNKPKGFLSYTKTRQSGSLAWNHVGYVASGVNGNFAATNPSDKLLELVYALKAPYRANARWVMSQSALAMIRKFKDGDKNYIWQPSLKAGQPSTLMGFPVVESEDMPAIANGSFSVAFGDFRQGYLILDRTGTRILRDPYSKKPYVLFYTTKRVGGGVRNFEAIKLMKFATS